MVRKNRQGGGGSLIASARCEGKCMLTKDVASLAPTVTLESEFDPRANALNAIRLILASGVILWHAGQLSGRVVGLWPAHQLGEQIFVDGFFAISGFLIARAWMRDPTWWRFLAARGLRIYPAFWACLAVIAFVIAPIANGRSSGQAPWSTVTTANLGYVTHNFTLVMNQHDIGGTPVGVPFPGVWDGSLWSLAWEFACYLGILALGVLGLLRRAYAVVGLYVVVVLASIVYVGGPTGTIALRLATMFLAGTLVYLARRHIPATWWMVAVAWVVVLAAMFLPDYRVVAAIPLAIALLVTGAKVRHRRLRLEDDVSYGVYVYGWPVQQTLMTFGAGAWSVALFGLISVLATLPLAVASWFLLEKRVMRLRPRRPSRESIPATSGD